MKILKQTSDDIFVLDNPRAPRFRSFEATFGWMEAGAKDARKSIHALLVGGRQEDDRKVIFEEWIGSLHDTCSKAIDVKDRLWLPRIWVDAREKDYIYQFRRETWSDGLCRYDEEGRNARGDTVYREKHPSDRWHNFRDHSTVAALVPLPDHVVVGVSSGMGRVFSLIQSKELLIHESCKELLWIREQKTPAEISDHPVMIAAAYLVWALENRREVTLSASKSGGAYRNLRK